MKKIITMFILGACLFVGCKTEENVIENENLDKVDNEVEENNDFKNEDIVDSSNTKYFIEIDSLEFVEKFNSDDAYLFFVGRDTCPACKSFKPTIMKFAKEEKFTIYYVNTTNFDNEDWDRIDDVASIQYIPTILITKDSSVLYNEYGSKSYETLKKIVDDYVR